MSTILVTGAAGFIGYHVTHQLLQQGHKVIGIDNLNAYYDVRLKHDRLAQLWPSTRFIFQRIDIADRSAVEALFTRWAPEQVVHLAAQAGVRYSLQNPHTYVDSNLVGFVNILEGCRHHQVQHLVFASSSSVYGANRQIPYAVEHNVDRPISLYAATKKANELIAHSYSHLYELPVTGLRFFTVYGPWGRPDMAPFKFTKAIVEGRTIDVYNYGRMRRDFTYIDDIVEGVLRTLAQIPQPNITSSVATQDSHAPYRIYNIGNGRPIELMRFVEVVEDALGMKARKNLMPMQPGDVLETYADVTALKAAIGFEPKTSLEEGIAKFVSWYQSYSSSIDLPLTA
ncbi:MAG: NAD-dependent epimerase [Phormidesmis sp. RL_2_1]|nr:NAD-dependent epimerase [Phormidesmis sp. RL_2_1]